MKLNSLSLWGNCGLTSHQQLRLRRNAGASHAHRFGKISFVATFGVGHRDKSALGSKWLLSNAVKEPKGDALIVVLGTMSITQSSHARVPIQITTIHQVVRDIIRTSSESSAHLIDLIP
jgi:hypothetical protein